MTIVKNVLDRFRTLRVNGIPGVPHTEVLGKEIPVERATILDRTTNFPEEFQDVFSVAAARADKPGVRMTRVPSEAEKNEAIIRNISKLLAEDKNVLTRHPSLKHLYERYRSVVFDVTMFGNPEAPVEPIRELVERVDILATRQFEKNQIKKRAYQNRQRKKTQEKNRKDERVQYSNSRR